MTDREFALRLAKLRAQKGVSARDMSLSLGQNPGYINSIENGKTLPSMTVFFYICEYLGVTPAAFFAEDEQAPLLLHNLTEILKNLPPQKIEHLTAVATDMLPGENQ